MTPPTAARPPIPAPILAFVWSDDSSGALDEMFSRPRRPWTGKTGYTAFVAAAGRGRVRSPAELRK